MPPSVTWMKRGDLVTYKKVTTIARSRSVNDEHGVLEVWSIDQKEVELHHDIKIPSSPLCTAWFGLISNGYEDEETGNLLAVGTKDTSIIQIWDLDNINAVEPRYILGDTNGHTDSVLALAIRKPFALASASADKLIKIWDLITGTCKITLEHHSDKVQAFAWSDHIVPLFISGSCDRIVVEKDVRSPTHTQILVTDSVESLICHPLSHVVGLKNGMVEGYDIRSLSSPLFTLSAHDGSVTSVCYNPQHTNILATASLDGTVKLWDLSNNQQTCVASKNPGVGGIYSISFSEDNPFIMAIGGESGKLQIWDTS
ncbi:uncharacterized WD repeat-containing protein C17D11.16-like [Vicia villosa]|uniref:uncharacterized WD repeat-containing protein C17D11.16-like n=1 Tax=Vicia villosa TaxID=3911 RepID=UPI00273AD137|nr:uncharacterized WD repeat-containing protein C17D11.16-like [Vicia villosa]XP_058758998.1 uncharacterized WD repeat-containing protein C17D11.16-like [Vicia villosa]